MNPIATIHPVKPSLRSDAVRAIERRSKAKRARAFKALGLTSRGGEFQRCPNRSEEERQRFNLAKWHALSHRRLLLGQTSRGRKRVYLITLPVEDFSVIQGEIDLLGKELAGLFDSLNAPARARVVQLANSLHALKMRIQVVRDQRCFQDS